MTTGETLSRVRAARASTRRRARRVSLGLVILLALAWSARVLLGDYTVTVPDFVRILGGEQIPGARFIVMESKLPRAVLGIVVGAALGGAGALVQDLLRNPLASPDVLGMSIGASAAAVIAVVLFHATGISVTVAALAGALAVAGVLVALSRGRDGTYTMIIVGVGLAAMLTAVIHWVLLRADLYRAHEAMLWLTGSLTAATWAEIGRLSILIAIVLPLLVLVHRDLALVALGDDLAVSLGVPLRRERALALLGVVVLVAACAAVCGPIAFVALLSGPVARRLRGGRPSIVAAALVGACLVVVGDYLAAYAIPGTNLPVGVVTGAAGAPFLLWLLVARNRIGEETT